ncbi:MAG: hypothetical protein LBP59_17810 [Planctomycetaceae bacterium]|jgi:proteasome lid subunit RPN8/RPN11|nr:hypothetical protein [Planctomycetaceae bacterium]
MPIKIKTNFNQQIVTHDIKQSDCVNTPFPLSELNIQQRPHGFQIIVYRSVLNAIKQLGRASMKREVGGMLIGLICWDKEPFLLIDASIEGKYTNDQQASVTFTAKTWEYVHDELEKNYPQKKIIGWYHTHPGFGIFLSAYDVFIQENFFRELWQTAYVFDPHAETDGFFIWQNNKVPTKPNIKPLIIENEPENKFNNKQTNISNNSINNLPNNPMNNFQSQEKTKNTKLDVIITLLPFLISLICIVLICLQGWQLYKIEQRINKTEQQIFQLTLHNKINILEPQKNCCSDCNKRIENEKNKITPQNNNAQNIKENKN